MMENKDLSVFERLRAGETVSANDPQVYRLKEESYKTKHVLLQMNNSSDPVEINQYLSQITGSAIDESVAIFTPLYINYGKNITIGRNVFINFNCTFLGLGGITIEDDVQIGPNVSLLSEGHPLTANARHSLVPGHVYIKKNAWIGAGAIILPHVTVGENAIVAAGAIVSKDVPDNVIAAGIPAKIIKKL